jgi:mannose-1-phosphate guanylyltransferase
MNAMILAAGRGTRLGALGEATPKILLEVDGEPLLARQIRYLTAAGVGRIVINAHHLADQIERFVVAHPRSADIDVLLEPELLGTAGGVRHALPRLGEEPFAVLYGDVLLDEPLDAVRATHRRARALVTITVYESDATEGKGTVEIMPDGCVAAFREKTGASMEGSTYVNAGLYVIDPRFMARLPSEVPLDFGQDVFPAALARVERIATHILAAPVIDVGTLDALERARSVRR